MRGRKKRQAVCRALAVCFGGAYAGVAVAGEMWAADRSLQDFRIWRLYSFV